MSGGCTNCGKKGGCDARKHEMMGAVDEALARLYPTRRWDQRADEAAVGSGIDEARGQALAAALSEKLKAFALYQPGTSEDYSDYIYVLCFGRQPCLQELLLGIAPPGAFTSEIEAVSAPLTEVYLRVALSALAPFAAVQELRMHLVMEPQNNGQGAANDVVVALLEQNLRAGVFDPLLLPRYQKLVAVLAEMGIRNVDFGEINEPPEGYEGGWHAAQFGLPPTVANYLFYAGPTAGVITESVALVPSEHSRNSAET